MSFFQGATNVTVQGGTLLAAGEGSIINISHGQAGAGSAFKDLSTAAAHTALHDSAARFGAPRCHQNTRTKYLDQLERWMLGAGEEHHDARLIWLCGAAGAGKSAIMQSIVERCTQHTVILGTFFFARTDSSRNHAEVLVPTLAFQMARAFPAVMNILDPIIQRNPLIFTASLHTQAYELLVRPLLYLAETGVFEHTRPLRRVFVLDGLDECDDPQQQALIIQAITSVLLDHQVPVSFLIASRPEVAIAAAFQRERRLCTIFASISLDGDVDAESDIRQFIVDNFLDIVETHPLRHHITLPWPDPLSIAKLVWKSSGHFVYAATAMKFIGSPDELPSRALEVVQGLEPSRTGSPFAELDALYLHILTSTKYSTQVLGILRHCYLTRFYKTVAAVCCVFKVSPADVELYLSGVQSLVFLSPTQTEIIITHRHATLEDFLADEGRAIGIYMDAETYHASLVSQYFRLLDMGPAAVTPLVEDTSIRGLELDFIAALATAVAHSRDFNLIQRLISSHSPQDIWTFCVDSLSPNTAKLASHARWTTIRSVLLYLDAIRESSAIRDTNLFIDQIQMYMQLLLDNFNRCVERKPQYRIAPALLFASTPKEFVLVDHLMRYCGQNFRIGGSYRYHFRYIRGNIDGVLDPRIIGVIKRLRQNQLSWRSDLAIAMKLVLQQLLNLPGTPILLRQNPRRKLWVRRSPELKPAGVSYDRLADATAARRQRCFILLKAVISYLHKSDCTGEVAKLTRRLLPKAALWFPRLMKRARAEMDAYFLRWEGSLSGIMEKAQMLSINDID